MIDRSMKGKSFLRFKRTILCSEGKWLEFLFPEKEFFLFSVSDVGSALQEIERAVGSRELFAAGFIAYEAAPAFDASLRVKADGGFPIFGFALFKEVREISPVGAVAEPSFAFEWRPSITFREYRHRIAAIRRAIRSGLTYQVNFSYRLQSRYDFEPYEFFVRFAEGAPFAAFLDCGEWLICSASPELFFRLDGEIIESRPMKGTAARGRWYEEDLAQKILLHESEKDRAENIMILDMVRNDIGRIAEVGSVQAVSICDVEKYPTVWQMTSTVRARTDLPISQIMRAVFPPASITGAPKCRTMEIIARLEDSPRRIYTGTIGFIKPGRQAQFNVAIRTLLFHPPTRTAEYGVGGGIVWDSHAEGEYQECLTKAKILSVRPPDFDLFETIYWSPSTSFVLLEYHLDRIEKSADYFSFRFDRRAVRSDLIRLNNKLDRFPHRTRMILSRLGNVRLEVSPLSDADMKFPPLVLAEQPIDNRDVFLFHKTTHRDMYDGFRATNKSADVLLYNQFGQITETTVANVAFRINGVLCTPPIDCGLLPGTMRKVLLEQNVLQEKVITINELASVEAVYLFNSLRGMQKVELLH